MVELIFKNEDRRIKILIGILLGIIFVRFPLINFYSNWRNLEEDIEREEIRLHRALKLIARGKEINRLCAHLAGKVSIEDLFLEDERAKVRFYKFLDNLAKKINLKLKGIRPIGGSEEGSLYFEIEGEADLIALMKLIYYLDNLYALTSILEVRLVPAEGGKISFRMKVRREVL